MELYLFAEEKNHQGSINIAYVFRCGEHFGTIINHGDWSSTARNEQLTVLVFTVPSAIVGAMRERIRINSEPKVR